MKKYSKKELLQIIKEYSNKLGRTPKMKEVAYDRNLPPINQFLKNFSTWNNLLKEANLEINIIWKYPKFELIKILKKTSKNLNRTPKIEDFNNNNNLPCPLTYFKNFGSWNNALKIAGLKLNVRKDYQKNELIKLLNKKAKQLKRSPKISDITLDKNMPDRDTYERHFGSYNKALIASGLKVNAWYRKWKKEEIIKGLRYKYEELGEAPGIRDFDKDSEAPGKNTVRKLFGNWTNALREANIPVKRFRSKEELIETLKELAKKLNRTPKRVDLCNFKNIPSYTPFVKKFGSYTKACLIAGLVPNDGRNNNIWKSWQRHCEEMAKVLYKKINIQERNIVDGVPDIYIPEEKLFIDAKTCGYKDFREQVKKYSTNGYKIGFWLIFKGIEIKSKKVKYIYAEELARKMKSLGREDLAAKCYQFVKNVYSDDQKTLV